MNRKLTFKEQAFWSSLGIVLLILMLNPCAFTVVLAVLLGGFMWARFESDWRQDVRDEVYEHNRSLPVEEGYVAD